MALFLFPEPPPTPLPTLVRTPSKLSELPTPENLLEEAARAFRLLIEEHRVLLSPCCSLAGSEQKAHACCQRTFHGRVLVGSEGLLRLPQATQEPLCFLPSLAMSSPLWSTSSSPSRAGGPGGGLCFPWLFCLGVGMEPIIPFVFLPCSRHPHLWGLTSSWKVPSPPPGLLPSSTPAG